MTIDIYGTARLVRSINSLDMPSQFLLGKFFPGLQTDPDSEEIHFDVENEDLRLAPFVHPLVEGEVVQSRGYQTKSFKPAYVKPKTVLLPTAPLKRLPGEALTGSMSPMERRERLLAQALDDHRLMLDRREEVMAAELLTTGKITVAGEQYPTVVVDFGRSGSLTKSLIGASAWGEAGVDPLGDLEDWAGEVQTDSGVTPRDVVMDPEAWKLFRSSPGVKEQLDRDAYRGGAMLDVGPMVRGQGNDKFSYKGSIGDLDFYVGQDAYIDPTTSARKKLLPDYTVILGAAPDPATQSGGVEGVRAYGCIHDEEAGFQSERFFAKSWLKEDPAVRYLLTQSAPLPVLYRPNGVMCATVAGA
jgi:hypothetical protein